MKEKLNGVISEIEDRINIAQKMSDEYVKSNDYTGIASVEFTKMGFNECLLIIKRIFEDELK